MDDRNPATAERGTLLDAFLNLALRVPTERFTVELEWHTAKTALGLYGASGAGKTTVLEALAGLRRDARGHIEVAGRVWLDSERGICLPPEARGVGYVPQEMLLFPHLDVLGNLLLGARRARSTERRLAPQRVLEVLELAALTNRPVSALSGGERQRVALGRALCSTPDLLLLDEPLASLDLPLRRRVLPYLLRVREEFGIPTLCVSHDPSEMSLLANEITVLAAGRSTARGRPDEVFGGSSDAETVVNVLRGTVVQVAESLVMVEVAPGLQVAIADTGCLVPGQRVAFELHGTDILLATLPIAALSAQNVLAARIQALRLPTGPDRHPAVVVGTTVNSALPPVAVVVSRRACRELALTLEMPVQLVFKAQACRLLASWTDSVSR